MDLPWDADGAGDESATLASSVLVVDDEAVVRDVLNRLLGRESDISVAQAEDAEAALGLLRDEKFDVLITDKNLPGMGGIELIRQARLLRPSVEAILITGYPSGESIIAALAAGASDYLVKPFDELRAVRAKIRAALERRTERARGREVSRAVAKEASDLLQKGAEAPEPVWKALEAAFVRYDEAVRKGGRGNVAVIGPEETVRQLAQAGISARSVAPDSGEAGLADVLVLELRRGWQEIAERMRHYAPDVILLGSPDADVGDLLEAIAMRLDLVDRAGEGARVLPDRVRAALDRRSVQQAQTDLVAALARFREALRG